MAGQDGLAGRDGREDLAILAIRLSADGLGNRLGLVPVVSLPGLANPDGLDSKAKAESAGSPHGPASVDGQGNKVRAASPRGLASLAGLAWKEQVAGAGPVVSLRGLA